MKNINHQESNSHENTAQKSYNSQSFSVPPNEVENQEKPRLEKNLNFNFHTPVNSNKTTKLMLGSMNSFNNKERNYDGSNFNSTNKLKITQNAMGDSNSNSTHIDVKEEMVIVKVNNPKKKSVATAKNQDALNSIVIVLLPVNIVKIVIVLIVLILKLIQQKEIMLY